MLKRHEEYCLFKNKTYSIIQISSKFSTSYCISLSPSIFHRRPSNQRRHDLDALAFGKPGATSQRIRVCRTGGRGRDPELASAAPGGGGGKAKHP